MNDASLEGFFAIPVLQKKIKNMDKFNQDILNNLDNFMAENENKKPMNWCCDLYVSGVEDNLLRTPLFENLKKPILDTANDFCKILSYDTDNYKLNIVDCLLNVYGVGHSQETHNHPDVDISGIYYPSSSELDGKLVIKSPFADKMRTTPIVNHNPFNANYIFIPTQTNNIVMFPSYLMHSVMPNKSERRVSISFNIKLVKKLKH